MRLSVLMSVYKGDNPYYLDQALKSIYDDQTRKPDEIVLVKDGPLTEDLENIISKWMKKLPHVLKVVSLERNMGLAYSLNEGLKYCTGDFIARMDSDDISLPERFEKQLEFFRRNKDVEILGGAVKEIDEKGNIRKIRKYPRTTQEAINYIAKASIFAHPTVCFRKSFFDKDFKYNENYKFNQDLELWFRALAEGIQVANIDDIVLYLRVSNNFFRRRGWKRAISEFSIYWNGIMKLFGYNYRLVYPVLRLFIRLMPVSIIKIVYNSPIRYKLLNSLK